MPRPSRPWFRFYVEALADRKLRRLTPGQRWLWVAVLAAARQSPIPGVLLVSEHQPLNEHDLADMAAMPVKDVLRTIPEFERSGMVRFDKDLEAWRVIHWDARQFESDDVTERTRKHRSNGARRNVPTPFPETPSNGSGERDSNKIGTHQSTETETELLKGSALASNAVPDPPPKPEPEPPKPQPPLAPPDDPLVTRWLTEVVPNAGPAERFTTQAIIAHLHQHLDNHRIDEAIGYCATLNAKPTRANYLLKTLTDWEHQLGVTIPPMP